MPRVAETRLPAIPSTSGQKERYQRILRAAADHGAEFGIERIQMLDVAKDAGVAIATLYRYFPSKTVLFTALLHSQVDRLDQTLPEQPDGQGAQDSIADVLIAAGRRLMARPRLAHAMLTSNNVAVAGDVPAMAVTGAFADLILKVGSVERATTHDLRLVRLIEQTWYGVLISQLNGHLSATEAEADTRLACRLLLADLGR